MSEPDDTLAPAISQAVFLVGGRGTRLGALTKDTPKPLLPVGDRPFIEHLLIQAARHGFDDILLLAGHLASEVARRYDGLVIGGATVRVLVEPAEAGTAGALVHARAHLAPRVLMANGDSYFDFNLLALTRETSGSAAPARLALRVVPDIGRYGGVALEGERITGFTEKGGAGPGAINAGIYALDRDLIDRIGAQPASIERDVFPALAAEGRLEGRVFDGAFIDIGVPEDFARAQDLIPGLARRPIAFLDRDGVINRDVHYAHRPDQIEWVPGAIDAIRRLNEAGYYVCVVTNQAGVARGLYGAADVEALHRWMQGRFRLAGAHVDSFHYCPHHPDYGDPPWRLDCACRKPAPGLLEEAFARWPATRAGSFLIGDKDSDLEAAAALGLPGIRFDEGSDLDAVVARVLASPRTP